MTAPAPPSPDAAALRRARRRATIAAATQTGRREETADGWTVWTLGPAPAPAPTQAGRPVTGPSLCPSFAPDGPGIGRAFAVIDGPAEAPVARALPETLPVDEALFERAAPHHPSELFRIAATCEASSCKNHRDGRCRLGAMIATAEPPTRLAPCAIRPQCRWWLQEGPRACGGCPSLRPPTAAILTQRRNDPDDR